MKNFLAKIWFPTLLVALAAFQSFGIDASRVLELTSIRDSLTLSRIDDSSAAGRSISDSAKTSGDSIIGADPIITRDSLALSDSLTAPDSLATLDSLSALNTLTAKDTIKIPDSLQFTDPFLFKYYIAVNQIFDLLYHRIIRTILTVKDY